MNYLKIVCAFVGVEVLLAFVFAVITQVIYKKMGFDFRSILKGIIERVFLFISLINELPHALTLFGALKLATRLKHTDKSEKDMNSYNDFYLIGNFISVIVAIGYVYCYRNCEWFLSA